MSESDELFCACLLGMGDIFSAKFQFWISIWKSTREISGFRICEKWVVGTWKRFFWSPLLPRFLGTNSLKTWGKFMALRSFIRRAIQHVFFKAGGGGGGRTCKNKQLRLESREYCCSHFFFFTCNTSKNWKLPRPFFVLALPTKTIRKGHDISWCWGDLWVGDSQRCWWAAGNPRQHHQRPRRPQLERRVWQWNSEYMWL